MTRSLLVLCLPIAFCLTAAAAERATPTQHEQHEVEEGCIGQREIEDRRRHQALDPEARLELARATYADLRYEPGLRSDSIGGTNWTSIGPANLAGRMSRIALHPTVSGTLLAGAAGGGVWKTTDSGTSWTPITEAIPNLFIGAVAYAPSDPSKIYVGTGEGDSEYPAGIGLIWSTDGGVNWNFPASVLADTFYTINVHPTNPDDIIVGTSKGAFRTTTGAGGTWTSVITGPSTPSAMAWGAVTDIERDPTNASVLYAATYSNAWCANYTCVDPRRHYSPTIRKSTDGGANWSTISTGLPISTSTLDVSRFAIALAPSSPSTLYAATSTYDATTGTSKSHIYKTTDAGVSWSETALSANASSIINNYLRQTSFDNAIAVSPTDPSVVVAGGVFYVRTIDGGTTWTRAFDPLATSIHVDVHDLVFNSAGTLFIANDGGFYVSADNGVTATTRNDGLVTRQFYTLAIDPPNRDRAYGGQQDNGTSLRADAAGTTWTDFNVGDGGGCGVDSAVSSYVISSWQNGVLRRTTDVNAASPVLLFNFPVQGLTEFGPFVSVVVPHPTLSGVAYTGTSRVWKTSTFGDAWAPLPTTTTDGSFWYSSSTVTDVAVSRSNPQTLMVTLGGGGLKRSTNGGLTWTSPTTGLPNHNINRVEIDPSNDQTAYVALATTSGSPVYMTTNGGGSWTPRSTGLPLWEAQVVRVDPTDSNTLYAGTEVGLYRSTDQGANWARFGTGLPAVAVYDIRISADGSILRAATHGRGVWELDITGVTNTQPVSSINTPATAMSVTTGTTVTFAGTVSDPDVGDSATGLWTFPDTWETFNTPAGASTLTHTFHKPGVFPVTLRAKDNLGKMATAHVMITVVPAADSCTTPIVIPGSGPFPIATWIDSSTANPTDAGDPSPISSCSGLGPYQTVWLSFTPTETGTYDFSFCGSKSGGVLALHTGSACGPYTPVVNGCLATYDAQYDCATASKVSVSLTAGVTIRILTKASFSPPDPMTLTISRTSATPGVSSVTPNAGPTSGGGEVVIYGAGFTSPTTVTIGGVAATNVTVADARILTANVPAHAAGVADVVVTSGGSTITLNGGYVYTSRALATPAAFVATPSGGGVSTTWSAVTGANQYEILRRSNGSYTSVGTTSATTFTDNSAASGVAYLYKVRALGLEGAVSDDSTPDLAVNVTFTDDPLSSTVTPVRATHVAELRTAVNAVRTTAGLGAFSFTGSVSTGTAILATHVLELRTALDEARAEVDLPALSYSFTINAGATIRTADMNDLRNGLK